MVYVNVYMPCGQEGAMVRVARCFELVPLHPLMSMSGMQKKMPRKGLQQIGHTPPARSTASPGQAQGVAPK